MIPKLVLTDIDGVWTDGGMYYSEQGDELKKFNTSDSAGVLFCRYASIPVAIITGEDTQIVARRAKKLKLEHCYLGVSNKVQVASELCEQLGVTLGDVAYIGDDINDYHLLRKVGFSAAPANAPRYIQAIVDHVVSKRGGDGAFREFVEHFLQKAGKLDEILQQYFRDTE